MTAWVGVHTQHAEDTGPKMEEFSRGGGLSCLPLGANSLRMDWNEWVMPGGRLARAALAGNKRRLAATMNVAKLLTDTWDRLHDGVKHADCPPCPPNDEIPSLCFVAGTCLCSSAGRLCEAFVHGLARLLAPQSARGWLVKKGRVRSLYEHGHLMLRVFDSPPAGGGVAATDDEWLLLAFGNLRTMTFTCMVAELVAPAQRSHARLRLKAGGRPQSLWAALLPRARAHTGGAVEVEVWQLSRRKEPLTAFMPGSRIHVERVVQPAFVGTIFDPCRAPARSQALIPWRPPRQVMCAGAEPVGQPPERPLGPQPAAASAALAAFDDAEGDAVGGCIRDRMLDFEAFADAGDDCDSAVEAELEEEDEEDAGWDAPASPAGADGQATQGPCSSLGRRHSEGEDRIAGHRGGSGRQMPLYLHVFQRLCMCLRGHGPPAHLSAFRIQIFLFCF